MSSIRQNPIDKVRQVSNEILTAFEEGSVPKALANIFLRRNHDVPLRHWSWRNRLIAALHGHYDARGYRQWQQVGRQVKAGERAFHILTPRITKAKADDAARGISAGDDVLVGFLGVAVFGLGQTEGQPPLAEDLENISFLEALPLLEVARSWGIEVVTYDVRTERSGALGWFTPATIGLGVENLSTWAHELVHAADHRLGTLSRRAGQQLDNEVVAEFGATVLLECLGYSVDSDRGGAYRYIRAYCEKHEREMLPVVTELVDRTCACVALILETADAAENEPPTLQETLSLEGDPNRLGALGATPSEQL